MEKKELLNAADCKIILRALSLYGITNEGTFTELGKAHMDELYEKISNEQNRLEEENKKEVAKQTSKDLRKGIEISNELLNSLALKYKKGYDSVNNKYAYCDDEGSGCTNFFELDTLIVKKDPFDENKIKSKKWCFTGWTTLDCITGEHSHVVFKKVGKKYFLYITNDIKWEFEELKRIDLTGKSAVIKDLGINL